MKENWYLRASWHNYCWPSMYHLTVKKADDVPLFGRVSGNLAARYGDKDFPSVEFSLAGKIVAEGIRNFSGFNEKVRLYQYVIMPDHVHLLIHVKKQIEKPLGNIMAVLKSGITVRMRNDGLIAADKSVFRPSFNDQIIIRKEGLDDYFNYIRYNPYRLLVRIRRPDYFTRIENLNYGGSLFQCYGNLQLLKVPFKEQVVIHRRDTVEEIRKKRERFRYCYLNGGVLVSPFISVSEKEIMKEAMGNGGRLILVRNIPLREREKPGGELFRMCEQGKLLLMVPLEREMKKELTRADCLFLNETASKICLPG